MAQERIPDAPPRTRMERIPAPPDKVIDPKDPYAQRRYQVRKRGGAFGDRTKMDPDVVTRKTTTRKAMVKT